MRGLVNYEAKADGISAIVTLKKIESLKGSFSGSTLKAEWINDSRGVPARWLGSKSLVVALKSPVEVNDDIFQVVQTDCSDAGLLIDSTEQRKYMSDLLK